MAALCNRAGHYIFALWFLSSIYLPSFFFPRLISAAAGWLSTIHGVASANLKCRSDWCCTRLAANAGPQKVAKKSPSGHHIPQLCQAISSQLRHRQSEKNLLSSNTSSTCPHNIVNFGPLAAEIISLVWFGAPQVISTGFTSSQRYCTAL